MEGKRRRCCGITGRYGTRTSHRCAPLFVIAYTGYMVLNECPPTTPVTEAGGIDVYRSKHPSAMKCGLCGSVLV